MRIPRLSPVLLCAAVLLAALPSGLRAAEPETLVGNAFDVRLDSEAGRTIVEVTFALALSETSNYPVTITAIGSTGEEVLWEGSLLAGVYRVRAPLAKLATAGLRVILRTRVTNRSERGNESYLVYQKWENR